MRNERSRYPNGGLRWEIAKRARFGWVTAALALGAAAGLLATDASRLARAAVFLPALLAGYGFFQAREKTWLDLASRGLRDLDGGPEEVDEALRTVMAVQVRRVHRHAFLAAAVFTAVVLVRAWSLRRFGTVPELTEDP